MQKFEIIFTNKLLYLYIIIQEYVSLQINKLINKTKKKVDKIFVRSIFTCKTYACHHIINTLFFVTIDYYFQIHSLRRCLITPKHPFLILLC